MTNLSSVSKAYLAALVALVVAAGAAAWAALHGFWGEAAAAAAEMVLLLLAASWLRRASNSVGKAIAALDKAAEGNLRARILGIRGHGNIGRMLGNINRLIDQMEAFTKETDAAMKAAMEGRFYRKILQRGLRGDFATYSASVNATLDTMAANAQRLAQFEARMLNNAVTVNMTVNEGAIANARIVGGIRSAVIDAQGMAAATEELVAGVEEISHNSQQVAGISDRARAVTEEARHVVETAMTEFTAIETAVSEAGTRVQALSQSSEAIGEILSSIEDIASQTNLLALNATIEAARTGEAGKGFAVVAHEVKGLATQTARATEDIARRIATLRQEMSGIVTTMSQGTAAIADGRQAMESMAAHIADVSAMVGDSTHRMTDISQVLAQQAAAANQISGGVQRVARQAEGNADAIARSTEALMGVEAEMSSLLGILAERDIPHKTIILATSDHVIWKKRLADMVSGRASLSADELNNEKLCRLGKWYYGPGSLAFRHHPAYRDLEEIHRAVHQNGIEAVRLFNAGQTDEALRHIALVEEASSGVLSCLDRLMTEKVPAPPAAAAGAF